MNKDEIFSKIKETLADSLEISADQLTMDTNIVDDLHADSISIMEFTLALEDAFGIEVSDDDADKIKTLGNVVDYVTEQTA
jgi:acyl carrier protein